MTAISMLGRDILTRVMAIRSADPRVGLVTAPYVSGRWWGAGLGTRAFCWSRLEALGISTDFMPGVLAARRLEGGIRFGLGSTLATTKTVAREDWRAGSWLGALADDYEMGARIVEGRVCGWSCRMKWSKQPCRHMGFAVSGSTRCGGRGRRGTRGGGDMWGWE